MRDVKKTARMIVRTRTVRLFAGALSLAGVLGCEAKPGKPDTGTQAGPAPASAPVDDTVTRGRYLVVITACSDCHTPMKMGANGPEPDMAQFLAGHPAQHALPEPPRGADGWAWSGSATNTAFAGPWGITYAINLTPDNDTGIGLWTEQVFVNALKTGRHMGVGRPILPPMPWPAYAGMTDQDLRAMYAYLRTIDAKVNKAPDAIVAPRPPTPPPVAKP